MLAAVAVVAILPVIVATASGNLDIPHNDAWSYSRIARTFGATGQIELLGWNRSALIGQFVLMGPLASSLVAQHLSVAVFGVVLVVCVYILLRDRVGDTRAGLASLAMALWPGMALLTTSFMTDVPSTALALLCLVVGRGALRRESPWLFALAMAVGLWGCTIRVTAIAAPVALVSVALFTVRRRVRVRAPWIALTAVLFVVLFGAFTFWLGALPGGDPGPFELHADVARTVFDGLIQSWFTIAIVVGPVAIFVSKPWRWRWPGWTGVIVAAAVGTTALVRDGASAFLLGNYLGPEGPYAAVLPPGKLTFGAIRWEAVAIFALVMGAILAGAILESHGSVDPLLIVFGAVSTAIVVVSLATVQGVFDRYLIAVVPCVLAVVLRRGAGERDEPVRVAPASLVGGIVAMAVTGCLAGLIAANGFAFDRARWTVAEEESLSVAPTRVDTGLEWLGWNSADGVVDRNWATGWGWQGMLTTEPSCVVVTASAPPGVIPAAWTLRREVHYPTFLFAGDSTLFIFDTHATRCDDPAA